MSYIFRISSICLLIILCVVLPVNATVLTFDDIDNADPTTVSRGIQDGYGNLEWKNFNLIHKYYQLPGWNYHYENGIVSGEWATFNAYDRPAKISSSSFDFFGAFFLSAYDEEQFLSVKAFLNGIEKYSERIMINHTKPIEFHPVWENIDTLLFDTSGLQFAMDDFSYNQTAPVPEPSSFLLLGIGTVFFGLVALKRKIYLRKLSTSSVLNSRN